jgi:NADH/NAD ratio-sensing transcriptional regulator Rex
LNKEDINHLNRTITSNEIEAVIKSLPKEKSQDIKDSWLNLTKSLKRTNTSTSQTYENTKGRNTTKPIL